MKYLIITLLLVPVMSAGQNDTSRIIMLVSDTSTYKVFIEGHWERDTPSSVLFYVGNQDVYRYDNSVHWMFGYKVLNAYFDENKKPLKNIIVWQTQ